MPKIIAKNYSIKLSPFSNFAFIDAKYTGDILETAFASKKVEFAPSMVLKPA